MIRANIWRAAVSAALLIAAAPLALAGPMTKDAKERVLTRLNHVITHYAFVPGVDFNKWPEMIGAKKEALEKADTEESFQDIVNETLADFKLTHLSIQTPAESDRRVHGESVGLGINVQVLSKKAGDTTDGIMVIRVVPGSAAQDAKLEPGDLITEADGKPVKYPSELAGKAGEAVELTIVAQNGSTRKAKVVRRKFSTIRKEELDWADADTAVLHVYTFDLSYDSDRVDTLMKKAAKAKNIVVDLRDNGGGVVANVQHFLGHFLPKQTPIGTFINKQLVERYVRDQNGDPSDLKGMAAWSDRKIKSSDNDVAPFKGPVVVLVNRGTGSGAEIAAAAMRETLGSKVVGTRSAGAVLVALMGSLPDDFTFLYPITDYVTSKGLRLEGAGVEPDITEEDPRLALPGTPDKVVDKAIALMEHPESEKKDGAKAG